jgi:transposase
LKLKGGEELGYDGFKHRKGTKIHAIVDEYSKPIAVAISPRNTHDSKIFNTIYTKMKNRPDKLYGDSAYDTEEIRSKLKEDGVQANIPINPRNGRKPKPYNQTTYKKMRSAAERFFAWIKSFRRITIRYERLASTYKALATIASIIIHLRHGIWR